MTDTIVIAGSLAQRPMQGGHTWVFLQYLLGFKRLGWNVLFLDRLEPEMCINGSGQPCSVQESLNLHYLLEVMRGFDLQNCFALAYNRSENFFGLRRQEVLERTRKAAFLLNVMGFFNDEEILGSASRRVFLDIDPGFGQMWHDLKLTDFLRGHDDYVTVGERIGQADCTVPTCGIDWITTPQPVVLEYWTDQPGVGDGSWTTIGAWRGPFGPLEYEGRTYGLRVHEFRKFVELPRLSGRAFQVALDIHSDEVNDLLLLETNGWSLIDPRIVAPDPWAYRAFIQSSTAEFMVAKNMYVQTYSGWLGDRSICYLASGKPVLAQNTGFKSIYPTGEGLLTFDTIEDAVQGVEEISRDYERHSRAARGIAEEFFDSDKVLTALLGRLGI